MNYRQVYFKIVQDLESYIKKYNIKSLILGISGGIDSTVCAAICREVCDEVKIPLIGRSLPIKNKEDEFSVSQLVGEAFCNDFKCIPLDHAYISFLNNLVFEESSYCLNSLDISSAEEYISDLQNPVANGNIQARLRMIYLYNLASIHNGIVIDTDNRTENNLGFFTIHGDQGDYKPIMGLWKTEVYELARWINNLNYMENNYHRTEIIKGREKQEEALCKSMSLTPTDGLGVSNSDLEQIGAKSYKEVDDILKTIVKFSNNVSEFLIIRKKLDDKYGKDVVDKILNRHINSKFKRNPIPGTYRKNLI